MTLTYATALSHTEYPAFYQARAVNDNNGDASYVQDYGTTFAHVKHYENGVNRDTNYVTHSLHSLTKEQTNENNLPTNRRQCSRNHTSS